MRGAVRTVLGIFGLLVACSREPALEGPEVAPSAAPDVTETRAPGENPFGFESEPLEGKAGELAFVPSKATIDGAFERGAGEQPFVYLLARLNEPGDRETRVRWSTGQRAHVPNALVIPVPRGQGASPGAIVLTTGASKTGLTRALVVPGGSPESPKVRYLDLVEGLAPVEPATLTPGSFNVLGAASEVGSTIACGQGGEKDWLLVVKRAKSAGSSRALAIGFSGKMRVVDLASSCVSLPLVPIISPGSPVYVPMLGRFVLGRVESVDRERGRVLTRFEFAGETRREAVGYANLALKL